MTVRNRVIQRLAAVAPSGRLRRALARFLQPCGEVRRAVFGRYELTLDLAMGSLQRELFVAGHSYELETQTLLRRLLGPGMSALDIGANVGFFSVLMGDLVGASGRVHAFEPHPPNFRLLSNNIQMNALSWVRPHPIALSDRRGTAVLSLNPVNDGGHSLGDFTDNPDLVGWDREAWRVTVETDTLDDLVREQAIVSPDVVKIDAEGAETLIIRGGATARRAAGADTHLRGRGRRAAAMRRDRARAPRAAVRARIQQLLHRHEAK